MMVLSPACNPPVSARRLHDGDGLVGRWDLPHRPVPGAQGEWSSPGSPESKPGRLPSGLTMCQDSHPDPSWSRD